MQRLCLKIISASLLGLILIGAMPQSSSADSYFKDTSSHWALDYIHQAVQDKLAEGYPDGSFKPNQPISEAEFLALLLRSYGLIDILDINGSALASDLPWHHPYYTYAYMQNWPLTFNNESGAYRRGQAAMLIASAVTGKTMTEANAISWLLDEKLSEGRTSATLAGYDKNGTLTRAEALAFIYKMRSHTPQLYNKPLASGKQASLTMNDTLDKLLFIAGKPDRIDPTEYGYSWYVYNSRYDKLLLVGISNNRIVASFTTANSEITHPAGMAIGITLADARALLGNEQQGMMRANGYEYVSNGIYTTLFVDHQDSDKIIGIQQQLKNAIQKKAYSSSLNEPYSRLLFDLANAERARRGVSLLNWDEPASKVAAAHSEDMAKRDYFSHTNPDNQSPFDRMKRAGIRYSLASENIAYGYQNPIYAHFALMNSTAGHRSTLLNSQLTLLGTGVSISNGSTPYYTQSFYTK